ALPKYWSLGASPYRQGKKGYWKCSALSGSPARASFCHQKHRKSGCRSCATLCGGLSPIRNFPRSFTNLQETIRRLSWRKPSRKPSKKCPAMPTSLSCSTNLPALHLYQRGSAILRGLGQERLE